MQDSKITFNNKKCKEFYPLLLKRIQHYFEQNKISTYANVEMYVHSCVVIFLWIASYILILSNTFGIMGTYLLFAFFGMISVCIGFIGHDVLHNAFVPNGLATKCMGYLADCIGWSSHVWKYRHNVLHHTYTNILEVDEDIAGSAYFLRRCPNDPLYAHHRFQHLYFPFLYSTAYLFSSLQRDFVHFFQEWKENKLQKKDFIPFAFFKLGYILFVLIFPFIFIDLPAWQIAVGELIYMATGGVFFAMITQLAHVADNVSFVELDPACNVDENWAIHEMLTTTNFATKSKLAFYITGGLNFQVEHHLLPHICHIHYPAISTIVKETAAEFDIPYHEIPTFYQAVQSHYTLLKALRT